MAKLEQCQLVLHKYNKLRYSYVDVDGCDHQILTSDPWAYQASMLQQRIDGSKGDNKKNFERALYYTHLAEEFYKSAETADLPAKGTLLYYGMLDLIKAYLSVNGVKLEVSYEHHGMTLPIGQEQTVEVKKPDTKEGINILGKFCSILGKPIHHTTTLKLEDVLSHIPEIQGIFSIVKKKTSRSFLPVSIEFQTNAALNKMHTEIIYDKEQEAKVPIARFLTGARAKYFKLGYARDKKVVYRSTRTKAYTKANLPNIYKNILKEYKALDIVPILTAQGYRYYVDLNPGDFHKIVYTVIAMFYLGTAARYRPLEIKTLLNGKLRPLVSEFVSISPRQFLYQMISLTNKKECVIPFSFV